MHMYTYMYVCVCTCRYDSQSSSVSSGSGIKGRKAKKPTTGLDNALDSLHSEPSGWGDLPSPKPTDMDNGTEIWGVAPDDMHRKTKSSSSESCYTHCTYMYIHV